MKKLSPEEKLLRAADSTFLEKMWKNLSSGFEDEICMECCRKIRHPIYYNHRPYHSYCLPNIEEVKDVTC